MTTSMLEKAIEIEGLLRIIRDGNPLPETYTLLCRKASELAEDANLLEENSKIKADQALALEDDIWAEEIARNAASDGKAPGQAENDKSGEMEEDDSEIVLTLEDEDEDPIPSSPQPLAPQSKTLSKLKSKFSLNDRFLYSRELFGGDMKMFDSTLSFIEGIESFPIIEDYFYGELEWDPENRYVALFMETLRPHFKE